MNICKNCKIEISKYKKYCSIKCANTIINKYLNYKKITNNRFGKLLKFSVYCFKCNKPTMVIEREFSFPKKERYYCSLKCANSHKQTTKAKLKLSKQRSGIRLVQYIILHCELCNKKFEVLPCNKHRRFCSTMCSNKVTARIGGLKSAAIQSMNHRSKNEIYFYELCKQKFSSILANKNIFNGWDADIILPDDKIAILWNGNWHYKKITKKHSVLQVQNRDKIKINEILKCGYIPYIIKDTGKYNKYFVENKFKEFLKWRCNQEV